MLAAGRNSFGQAKPRAEFKNKSRRSKKGSTEIAQFVPVLYILFLVMLLPMIDLMTAFIGAATQYLATNDLAAKASTQADFAAALNTMVNEANQFESSNLSKFVKMSPAGGYTGCGDDLYVLVTNTVSGVVTTSQPNQAPTQSINTVKNTYEMSVRSVYSLSPLISLACIPLLGSVPGLGQPMILTFSVSRPVEHVGGLIPAAGNNGSQTPIAKFIRVIDNPATTPPPTPATWRTPNIFQQIQAAGQTVVSVNVFPVYAFWALGTPLGNAGGWNYSGVTVVPGQKVWIDTQAVGIWSCGTAPNDPLDATGYPPGADDNDPCRVDGDANVEDMAMVGYVGTNPPVLPFHHCSGAIVGDPHFIVPGNTMLNYPINYPGPISFIANDNNWGDWGTQIVRIVVTQ